MLFDAAGIVLVVHLDPSLAGALCDHAAEVYAEVPAIREAIPSRVSK
jgi:hypothetical protein